MVMDGLRRCTSIMLVTLGHVCMSMNVLRQEEKRGVMSLEQQQIGWKARGELG
jgi:hypothetical protein